MEPDLSPSTDLPPDSDEMFVIEYEERVPYPFWRRRAVAAAVTVAWMILMGALCAYILLKW